MIGNLSEHWVDIDADVSGASFDLWGGRAFEAHRHRSLGPYGLFILTAADGGA